MKVLKGNHFEVNYQIAKEFVGKIKQTTFKKLEEQKVENILSLLKDYPFIVQELEGRAKGLGITVSEYLYLTSYEIEELEFEKCSDIYVALENDKYIIHNEDGQNELKFYLCDYEDGKVLDFSGYDTLHGTTFSATKDIMISINYIYNTHYNIENDFPTWIFTRIVLSCKNIKEVIKVLKKFSIWGSVSINLLDVKENKLYSIEKSLSNYSLKEINGIYFHTNTIIHDDMLQFSTLPKHINTSQTRYDKIKELLSTNELSFKEIMLYNNGNDYESVKMLGKNKNKSKTQATIQFSREMIEILGDKENLCFPIQLLI